MERKGEGEGLDGGVLTEAGGDGSPPSAAASGKHHISLQSVHHVHCSQSTIVCIRYILYIV